MFQSMRGKKIPARGRGDSNGLAIMKKRSFLWFFIAFCILELRANGQDLYQPVASPQERGNTIR
jgi:hypothetical protein